MKQNVLSSVLQLSVSLYASCPLPFRKEGLDGKGEGGGGKCLLSVNIFLKKS